MVNISNLTKLYDGKVVLKDINYTFNNKGLYIVVGESGVGKTTLLNIISNRDKEYIGKVNSNNVFYITIDDLIGYFSVKENIELFKDIYPNFKDKKTRLGIEWLYNKKVNNLSNGEKQRLCIYISICINEDAILLDEPTSSLDTINKNEVIKLIEKESKNKLFIVVTHEPHLFNNYKEIHINEGKIKGSNKIRVNEESRSINNKKISKVKYGIKLIKKNSFNFFMFFISFLSIAFSFSGLKTSVNNLASEFESSFKSGEILYKSNELSELNDENIYSDILLPLSSEISEYGSGVYSYKMYEDKVYLDNYYYDNAFALSFIYESSNVKEDEVIVSIDFDEFCKNNNMIYCVKDNIKNNLIGKNLYYKSDKLYIYKIRYILEGDNTLYFNNVKEIKNILKSNYMNYNEQFYINVKKDKLDSFYNKINNIDSLLNYDFIEYFNDENNISYLINKSENQYFSFKELKDNHLIGCSKYGVDCSLFYYGKLTSLVYIDEIDVNKKIIFERYSEELNDNEIIISSFLGKIVNKAKGEYITLKYQIEGEIYLDTRLIKDVINENDYKIYHNSNYSYDFIYKISGEVNRVGYAIGDSKLYKKRELLNSENVSEIKEELERYFSFIFIGINVIEMSLIFFFLLLEGRKNKKYQKLYTLLENNNVSNYNGVFMVFNSVYFLFATKLIFIDLSLFAFYCLSVVILFLVKKIKTQVSLG